MKKDTDNGNYLYMKHQCTGEVKIENTEEDGGKIILIVTIVCSIVFIIIVIIIIVCCCRTCKRRAAMPYGGVGYMTPVGYGVSPYSVQPVMGVQPMQPVVNVQPYGVNYSVNPNYGQSVSNAPVPLGGSSLRMDNTPKYEKPIA